MANVPNAFSTFSSHLSKFSWASEAFSVDPAPALGYREDNPKSKKKHARNNRKYYLGFKKDGEDYWVGDVVLLEQDEDDTVYIGMITSCFEEYVEKSRNRYEVVRLRWLYVPEDVFDDRVTATFDVNEEVRFQKSRVILAPSIVSARPPPPPNPY